ncbi:hypothetical protein AC578_6116 [Pseudocercospora eumusae]|uniref:Uncharacterized protein n=1 Tax=Pseudocercospora eumusae TaxID=321146 RepID=A0A139HVI4_9PEZI|nr:hypothetical protein AC578_6116 [Pseudocercospora eumusae]
MSNLTDHITCDIDIMAYCATPIDWPVLTPSAPHHHQHKGATFGSISHTMTSAVIPLAVSRPFKQQSVSHGTATTQLRKTKPGRAYSIEPAVPLLPEPAFKSVAKLSKEAEDDDIPSDYHGPPIGHSIKRVHHKSLVTGSESITTYGNVQAPRPVYAVQCDVENCVFCKSRYSQKTRAALNAGILTPPSTMSNQSKYTWQGQPAFNSPAPKWPDPITPCSKQGQRSPCNRERLRPFPAHFPATPTKFVQRKTSEENGLEVYGSCQDVVSVKRSPPMVSVATLEKGLY